MAHYNEEYWKKLNVSMNEWSELVICYESTTRRYQFGYNSTEANHLGKLGLVELTPDDGGGSRYGQMTITAIGKLLVDMSDSFSKPAEITPEHPDFYPSDWITEEDGKIWELEKQAKRLNSEIEAAVNIILAFIRTAEVNEEIAKPALIAKGKRFVAYNLGLPTPEE